MKIKKQKAKNDLVCEGCYCTDNDDNDCEIFEFKKIIIISAVPYQMLCKNCLEKMANKKES